MSKNINMVDAPEGHVGEGFFATKLDQVVGLARANPLWPLPFATSCVVLNLWQQWLHITI